MAPSGVQKERLDPEEFFIADEDGNIIEAPVHLKISECTPLFMNAYKMRNAGAVLHSHSQNAVLATMLCGSELRITNLEMIKVP